MYIENINGPEDVKKLSEDQLNVLAEEIRDALLKKLSKHGGHFGPNFGMVEATIAMHSYMKNIMMMYQDTVIQEKVSMIISQLGIHQLP